MLRKLFKVDTGRSVKQRMQFLFKTAIQMRNEGKDTIKKTALLVVLRDHFELTGVGPSTGPDAPSPPLTTSFLS